MAAAARTLDGPRAPTARDGAQARAVRPPAEAAAPPRPISGPASGPAPVRATGGAAGPGNRPDPGRPARPEAAATGAAERARASRSTGTPPRRGAGGPILLLVGLLAVGGLGGWLFLRQTREPSRSEPIERPHDPSRTYAIADAIDHRQMRPVWTLVNMSGLERLCEKARAFTVTREADGPGVVPTRFVVYCRDQGFWVVEADPVRERFGTIGPLRTREEVEAAIDREGEFLWGSRPPGQRSFVGGLARDR